MKNKSKIMLIFLIIIALVSITFVSANENESVVLMDNNLEVTDNEVIAIEDNNELIDEDDSILAIENSDDEIAAENEYSDEDQLSAVDTDNLTENQKPEVISVSNDDSSVKSVEKSVKVSKVVAKESNVLGAKDIYINSIKTRYDSGKYLHLGWTGYFNGYFKVYNGSSLYHKEKVSGYNKKLKWSLKGLNPGNYTAKLVSSGVTVKSGKIIIVKSRSKISVKSFTATAGKTFYCYAYVKDRYTGKNYNGGIVKFKINGKIYKARLKSGVAIAKIKIPSKVKNYTCKATFTGGSNVYGKSVKFNMTVKPVYKVIRIQTKISKSEYVTKVVGKYKAQTFKVKQKVTTLCVFLFKNNKILKKDKFLSKYSYKVNGKWYWTKWRYGTTNDVIYHKYDGISNNIVIGDVKIKYPVS